MTKILVTGATGFVGKALVQRLRSEFHDVVALSSKDGDIADPGTLRKVSGTRFSRIYHLAGRSYVPDSWDDPAGFYRTNVLGTANVLELALQSKAPVTFMSAYVYGTPERLPISENSPVKPDNPYALSKHLAEQLCRFYHTSHDLPISVLRPFNAYGLGQRGPFLIPTVLKQVLHQPEVIVNDLTPRRDFVYIEDLIDVLFLTLKLDSGFSVYNIGSGGSVSVKEVIDIAQSIAQTRKAVISRQVRRSSEIDDVVADISKARLELNWRPHHSIQEGLEIIITSMRRGEP